MNRQAYRLNITGKNSSEVYVIVFPDNLIKFIEYDFAPFMEKCVELCRAYMRMGAINHDEVSALRSSLVSCHKYLEKNIYGIFEKIVLDCWIDYICSQNKIDESTLWDSFSSCRNDFESTLFTRLCEYRYNRAINQWTNLVRVQEYARRKTEFVFGKKLDNHSVAIANAGYFDLLFNVAATEMGCGELSASKVYSGLRTPNSPFVMAKLSREIMRKILPELDYNNDISDAGVFVGDFRNSDKPAMEIFSAIKNIIPAEPDSLISVNSIMRIPQRVYIPEGFKSVIDLEIDVLLESGAVIQKCGRCMEYFLKDEEYNYNYCSRVENGLTCLDIVGEKIASSKSMAAVDTTVLYARCDQLYKEMSERVNVDMNQRDFSDWYKYMALIRENVVSGQASMDDFENFAEYSRTISFSLKSNYYGRTKFSTKSVKPTEAPEREVRAFEFERIERTPPPAYTLPQPPPLPPSVPIPYAPTKTARVIRGVEPVGVKELPIEFPPEPSPVFPVPIKVLEELNELENVSEIAETEEAYHVAPQIEESADDTERDDSVAAQPKKVDTPVPTSRKTKKPTRINKHGKGLLLQNPYEGGMLQNPYIRDLVKPDETKADNDIKLDDDVGRDSHGTPLESADNPQLDNTDIAPQFEEPAKFEEAAKVPKAEEAEPLPEIPPKAPQLDFNSILSGIQRSDGFEKTKETAQEDAPVSHKTKRVMDSIFGKSKIVNPFVTGELPRVSPNEIELPNQDGEERKERE
jgi:hypothetical protein